MPFTQSWWKRHLLKELRRTKQKILHLPALLFLAFFCLATGALMLVSAICLMVSSTLLQKAMTESGGKIIWGCFVVTHDIDMQKSSFFLHTQSHKNSDLF